MSAQAPDSHRRWTGLIPLIGCATLAGASLALYIRDVYLEQVCRGSLVCGDFRADVTRLAAGVGLAILAAALALGTLVATPEPGGRRPGRPWLALTLTMGVVSSFAVVVIALTLSGQNPGASLVAILVGWTFLGIGYLVLWLVAVFPAALIGAWTRPARGLALVHGSVSIVATLIAVSRALGPGPLFL